MVFKKSILSSKALSFSLLKYLEIGVTALTTFFVAEKIGPLEMGRSVSILLYITYANYLALGLNQAITKNYSRFEGATKVKEFITINLQYLIVICLVNFALAILIIDDEYFWLTAIISCGTLIRGFFMSYFRAVYKIGILNKNNLIYATLLLGLVFSLVTSWLDYMFYWSISIWICITLYFFDARSFFLSIMRKILTIPQKKQVLFNFSEGIKLAVTGLISTFLLTVDRLVISQKDFSLEIKGTYQLADHASVAFYMVVTTVFFYFYPKWIELIRKNYSFRIKFLRYIKIAFYTSPIICLVVFGGAKFVSYFLFNEFVGLEYLILLSVWIKINVVLISMVGMIYIGLDEEPKYIYSMIPILLICVFVGFCLVFFKDISVYLIPTAFGIIFTIEVFRKLNGMTILLAHDE